MKISINTVHAHCTLCCFQYFLQLTLELLLILFYFIGTQKKMIHVLSLVLALKQQFVRFSFIELINGRSQTNRDQKSNLLFLQRHDQSQKFRLKLVKNRQKALQRD